MLREALTRDRLRAMAPDEAAALFVARRAEGLTPSETELFGDWLDMDEGHAAALRSADQAWDSFADAEGDEILAAMRAHALEPEVRRRSDWPRRLAVAAGVLLVLASSLFLLPSLKRGPTPGGDESRTLQFASTTGQVRDIALPDGSQMTLDADSLVTARFEGNARSIQLVRGRALFAVKKDPSRPFAVTAATRRVVALGTRFEVGVAAGTLKVVLMEGHVAVEPLKPGPETVMLTPGQQFVERGGAVAVGALPGTGATPVEWRRGLVVLDDVPLAEAVAEIGRYSTDRIVIGDRRVAAMRVSGQFRAGDAERFARTVAEVHPLRVTRRGQTIEITPAG